MKDIIFNKTVLIPEIICEMALWELMEDDAMLRQIEPNQCGEIVKLITPGLVAKADRLYVNNKQFKRGITSNEKGRDKLVMWFKHWAHKPIKEYFQTHTKDFALPF